MELNFYESKFSIHFTRLTFLGVWPLPYWNASQKKIYIAYQTTLFLLTISAIVLQMIELYFNINSFRKVTYNLCTSIIVIFNSIRMTLLYARHDFLDNLRWKLWKDSLRFSDEEDIAIQDDAYHKLSYLRKWFYIAAFIFLPAWMIVSYFSYLWGPRELAFAGYIPIDTSNDKYYVPALVYQGSCAIYVISLVIETDLAMFSIVLQIAAQYRILMKNLLRLNEIYADSSEEVVEHPKKSYYTREVNHYLKAETTKKIIKSAVVRQIEIFEYVSTFEYVFSRCMFLHIIGGSFLILMNGLELTILAHEISAKLCYQTGYLTLIVVDIFFVCYYLSELSTECCNVGQAAYKVFWYKMDPGLRRSLNMIIARSQKPPRITAGKLFQMNLKTYQEMLKNIYSWLMLFRQMALK